MDRQNLVAAGFHSHEGYRHHDEYNRTKDAPAKRIEGVAELGFVERFNRMSERLQPLLKSQGSYDKDWHITPEVPLTGMVEGQEFTVHLSIQVQYPGKGGERIHPHIHTDGRPAGGMSGIHTSRRFCDLWENSERKNQPLEELDQVEEIVEIYLETVAALTPKQLHDLGFPSEYVPEDVQLSLLDYTPA